MKKTLLLVASIATFSFGYGQTNLVQNGTADDFSVTEGAGENVNDNADAWDMTPNSKVIGNDGVEIDSPYTWSNSALADWLADADNCGDSDEQPGSSSDGNYVDGVKTRGVKLNEACRRLYQVVAVTPGNEYTFSIESRSEAENVPSDVFMLNTEIASEDGLSSTSSTVDAYMEITNDFNASKSSASENNFTTTTFDFTASSSIVVIYVRATAAVNSDNEVFYDNISLIVKTEVTPPPTSTNLVQNGTADDFSVTEGAGENVNDNADAWDMTPNSKVIGNDGVEIDSPYTWSNSALADWLADADNCGDSDEQPGSSSDGNYVDGVKTRGVKLNEACRRLYQVVSVEAGKEYTFSIESRSEAENVPSDVFMLNTEIASEDGLSSTSSTVDAYMEITNDFNASKSSASENNFTTTTFDFTASSSIVVIYVRATAAVNSDNEVFYDNISLKAKEATASVNDVFSTTLNVYPNPTSGLITVSSEVSIDHISVYNVVGKQVISNAFLSNNKVDISSLSSGMYILKLTSGNSVATRKIIKQ